MYGNILTLGVIKLTSGGQSLSEGEQADEAFSVPGVNNREYAIVGINLDAGSTSAIDVYPAITAFVDSDSSVTIRYVGAAGSGSSVNSGAVFDITIAKIDNNFQPDFL